VAKSEKACAIWISEKTPIDADMLTIVDGWIKTESGSAWLEVSLFDASGTKLSESKCPRVAEAKDWTYVAVEIPRFHQEAKTISMQIAFSVEGGRALLDDVGLHSTSLLFILNGDFETPVDKKGRISFWSEETESTLSAGERVGSFALSADRPSDGTGCVALTVSGEWFAISNIPYPIWSWTERVDLHAMTRLGDGAQAQLVAVWMDSAQQILCIDPGETVEGLEWHPVTAGVLTPPEGACYVRPVLIVRKKPGAGASEATAWFDNVDLKSEDKPSVRVVVNQVGYEQNGPKSAVALTNFFPNDSYSGRFEVVGHDGRVAWQSDASCSGRIYGQNEADWGWYFWRIDFSSLQNEGTFRVRATFDGREATSFPFRVGKDVLFQETAGIDTDFFFVQRCGYAVPGWFPACHLDDAKLKDGTHRDLTGEWHSAGDYNKLIWEYGDGGVMYALVNAMKSAPKFFEKPDRDKDGLCDIVDEAWWGAKFLAKVQVPETGGFLNHIEQGPDRKTWMNWCPPDKTTDNVVGTADDPIVTDGEGHSPLAIGGWANLSVILTDRGIQNDYLDRAIRLWEYATKDGTVHSDPLLLISTVDLYLVKGEERFLTFCQETVQEILESGDPRGQLSGGYGGSGDIPAAALAHFALRFPQNPLSEQIRTRLEKHLPHFIAYADNPLGVMRQKTGPDGYFFEPTSSLGCNYQICSQAWSALMIYRVTGDRRAWEYAADQIDFLFGKNPYDVCMMEGKGSFNLPRYHHRYITIPGHERGAVPGAIPNGFVRDIAGNDRPGLDLSTGGRLYPSYRTNEPWLVHNVFYTLAITALHEAQRN